MELGELLATKLVTVAPLGEDIYFLRPRSRVGTAVTQRLRLLIRPKIALSNVFFYLSYAVGQVRWNQARFPYAEEDDLLKAVAHLFEAEVALAGKYGLLRGYRDREETLATVRGRIDLGAQLRKRQGRAFPLENRYQEYSEDIRINQVLRAALEQLLRVPGLDTTVRRRLIGLRRQFADVARREFSPRSVPQLVFDRLTAHWESAARLAQLILRHDSIRDEVGPRQGISFTVNMPTVFERFVESVVREEARRRGWTLIGQANRRLTTSVEIRPDLVLRHGGIDCAVGDAKYKELEIADWPHADLYQLLGYCTALGLSKGLLIFADSRKPRVETVLHAGTQLEIVGVDLSSRPREVLARTRDAASKLLRHAAEHEPQQLAA
jgi:5-methylcytosine-specific restriction enzyme subunit McrC